MKNIIFTLLALTLGFSIIHATAFTKDIKNRNTKVQITSEKPLTTGSNTLILTITKDSKTLTDVRVKAFMPAMPGMPAMDFKTNAEDLGNGNYKITLNIAMNGTWQLHIFITPKDGKKSRIKTSLNF